MATEATARRPEADDGLERGRIDRRDQVLEANTLGAERRLQTVDRLLLEPTSRLETRAVHDAADRPDLPGDVLNKRPHGGCIREITGVVACIDTSRSELRKRLFDLDRLLD